MMHITAALTILALLAIHSINGNYQEDVLNAINTLRKAHGVPNLNLYKDLSDRCIKHAKYIAKLDVWEYSEEKDYSESICCEASEVYDPLACVQDWYQQIKYYDFDKAEPVDDAEDFQHIVWKSTEEVGIGHAQGKNKNGYRVCLVVRFFPANYDPNKFSQNLPKFSLDTSSTISVSVSTSTSTTPDTSSSSIAWNTCTSLALLILFSLALYIIC